MLPVLLYGCETWTIESDLERRINVFGTKCLRMIMEYRWNDFISHQRLLRETESKPVTSIVCERQLRLYGHVARIPDVDPAHRVLSVMNNPGWRRPRGVHVTHSWRKSIDHAENCLGWKECSHGGWPGRTVLAEGVGVVAQRAPRRMLPIDDDEYLKKT